MDLSCFEKPQAPSGQAACCPVAGSWRVDAQVSIALRFTHSFPLCARGSVTPSGQFARSHYTGEILYPWFTTSHPPSVLSLLTKTTGGFSTPGHVGIDASDGVDAAGTSGRGRSFVSGNTCELWRAEALRQKLGKQQHVDVVQGW